MISPQHRCAGRVTSRRFLPVASSVAVFGCLVALLVLRYVGRPHSAQSVLPREICVYYVYFGSETMLPVSRESIKHTNGWSNVAAGYNQRMAIRDRTTISGVYRELHQRTSGGRFDEGKVRLCVTPSDSGQPLWVDAEGGLATASSVYTLRPAAFMRLRQVIHRLLPPTGAPE
jgi:hypothetical protein